MKINKKLFSFIITFVVLISTPFGLSFLMGSKWIDWVFVSSLFITANIVFFNLNGDGLIGRLDKSTVQGKTGISAVIDHKTEIVNLPFSFYVSLLFTIGTLFFVTPIY
ncbi:MULTISPECIES: hypothetical protein [unclassified Bacillus (in: firmicutes)]|uniref:hypothetical protein n=1 Tax=unclassified Bacillus (in: firmicutes) TaxID=185979 RepID=UPI000BF1D8AE|nr:MULTISPECIES: hypothetical protein [unclassified Bacillus (in: firmicutes)]PEJ46666.1 hypothetical protein CN692_25530 [Bacillus sp. AFS002410]PEL07655.1 hypothetical protein CN601_19615 [Bacillus sp. AFS017336]